MAQIFRIWRFSINSNNRMATYHTTTRNFGSFHLDKLIKPLFDKHIVNEVWGWVGFCLFN
jgi:hypothetical protein